MSDDDSFEFCTPRFIARVSALKGHLLGHALSSFQRSLPIQPNPDLDAPDSFQLPSGVYFSPQANISRLKQTVILTYATRVVKRVSLGCATCISVARTDAFSSADLADETAAPSQQKPLKEKRLAERALVCLDVNRLV